MPAKVTSDSIVETRNLLPSHPFRIYTTDDHGTLSLSLPAEDAKVLLKVRAIPDNAVHKMARGRLQDSIDVLALARQSGDIDVVDSTDGRILLKLPIAQFKKGFHRWAGLAIAKDGLFACSSAGIFTYIPLEVDLNDNVVSKDVTVLELPEPLQSVQFEPAIDPKFLAFGGETVPLSVWGVRKAVENAAESSTGSNANAVSEEETREELHGKAKKRRRAIEKRIKNKELLPSEVWRAKNLPNSPIGLVNKPSISSIAFLEQDKIAVGTRHGMLQLYHIGSQRKPIREISLFGADKNPVKLLSSTYVAGQMIAADNIGRVFVVDYTTGKILYKYEMFTASALSLCPLPLPEGSQMAYLVTSAAERLLRFHSMPVSKVSKEKSKENGKIISTIFKPEGVKNVLWDGVVPEASFDLGEAGDVAEKVQEDLIEETDDIWQEMAIVGDEEQDDQHRSQRRRV